MKQNLGRLEAQFLAYTQMRGWTCVRTGEVRKPMRLTADQERKLLSRLSRAGMIARVWRGLYLVPPRLPPGGAWSPDEGLALATLMAAREGRYQICGPNAFNHYGFDEQMPNRIYAYNNRLSGDRRIGSVHLTLIKVANKRLGAIEEVATADGGPPALYSSRARTLIDAIYDWSRFATLPRAYGWIRTELEAERVAPADLVRLALRYGDKGTIRRMGALLEREGVQPSLLHKLERTLPATSSPIPWIPRRPKRGPVSRRWGVVWNDAS